jgi:4-hydroxyphenylpyruvate dioxygenase
MRGQDQLITRSAATITLGSGPLEAKLEAAAAAGFYGTEICIPDLAGIGSLGKADVLAARLGLKIFALQPLRDTEGVTSAEFKANLARARIFFETAAELGAGTVIAVSNCTPGASSDPARTAGQLGDLADAASSWGLRIAYEALSWGTRVSTTADAWRIVRAANRPNLGICLDSFHFGARGEDPALVHGIPGKAIAAVQLAGALPRPGGASLLEWSRHRRCFPDRGWLNVTGFAAAVLATGYAGPWSLEIFSDRVRAMTPGVAAEHAMASFGALERQLASNVRIAV